MKNRASMHTFTAILSLISALFIIGFSLEIMWDIFHIKGEKSFLILGSLSYILSIFMLRGEGSSSFTKYLGVIFYISSVIMFYLNIASHSLFRDMLDGKLLTTVELFTILILQIIFYISVKGFFYRVLASFAATFTIYNLLQHFGLYQLELPVLLAILLLVYKSNRAIAYGTTITLLLATLPYIDRGHGLIFNRGYYLDYNFTYIVMTLVLVLAIYFVVDVLKSKELFGSNKYTAISLIGAFFGIVLFFFQPAIAVTIFLVIFWFYAKSSTLMVASFLLFGFHLYRYYYMLNSTLLEKSYYLLASALVMFALKFIVDKGFRDA